MAMNVVDAYEVHHLTVERWCSRTDRTCQCVENALHFQRCTGKEENRKYQKNLKSNAHRFEYITRGKVTVLDAN